ncbi:MAG: transporter [Candidatus Kapaibacterium sp.]
MLKNKCQNVSQTNHSDWRSGWIALLVTLILSPSLVVGQGVEGEELVTDRPDQTESASTIAPGSVQIEAGVEISVNEFVDISGGADSTDTEKKLTAPALLVRVGLFDGVELRIGGSWISQNFDPRNDCRQTIFPLPPCNYYSDLSGLGDISVGGKVRLMKGDGLSPQVALLAHLTLPVGADGIAPEVLVPDIRLAMAHDLSETFSLGYNIGGAWEDEEFTGLYTVALGLGLTDAFGCFFELYGNGPWEENPEHSFDSGLTWLVTNNVQLDIASGIGLTEEAEDLFLGAGLSVRLPR